MSKKTATKKSAKKPDPKAAGERALNQRKIAMEEEELRVRRIVSKVLEPVHERLTALESRSAPAEAWNPKVGDKIVRSDRCLEGSDANHHPLEIGQVGTIKAVWSDRLSVCEHRDGMNDYYQWRFRAATFAEIADHKAKEERAKPLEFGMRVKWGSFTGRVACEGPDHQNEYLVAYKPGNGSVWHSTWVHRCDLTIID